MQDGGALADADDRIVAQGVGAVAKHLGFQLDFDFALRGAGANHLARLRVTGRRRADGFGHQLQLKAVFGTASRLQPLAQRVGQLRIGCHIGERLRQGRPAVGRCEL